jgi:hypothetical protein
VGALLDGYHAGMPSPTGRTFSAEQIWIFTVRDGRIAEIRAVSIASTCSSSSAGTGRRRTEQVRLNKSGLNK